MSREQENESSYAAKSPLSQGPVYIACEDFFLRSLAPSDVNDRVLSWLTSKEMLEGLNLSALEFDIPKLQAFIANFNNLTNYFIGIFSKKDNLLIGFYTIDVMQLHKVGALTAGLGEKNFQGKYVFWRTIDPLIDFFYANRDIYKFTARIVENNLRMLFNFKDNPRFELEAVLKNECLAPSGNRVDILVFASFRDDGRKPAPLDYNEKLERNDK